MAAPGPPVAGTVNAGTGTTVNPTYPATVNAGDIAFCWLMSHQPTTPLATTITPPTPPSGGAWQQIGALVPMKNSAGTNVGVVAFFWRVCVGNEDATTTGNWTRNGDTGTDSCFLANLCTFPGAAQQVPYTQLVTNNPNASTTVDFPAITTPADKPEALILSGTLKGGASGNYGTPANWTTVASNSSTSGSDGGMDVDYRQVTAAGTYDPANVTVTTDADTGWVAFQIAFVPPLTKTITPAETGDVAAGTRVVAKAKAEDEGFPANISVTADLKANTLYLAFIENSAASADLRDPTVDSPNETWAQVGTTLTVSSISRMSVWRCVPTATRSGEVLTAVFDNPSAQVQTGATIILVEVHGVPVTNNGADAVRASSFTTVAPGSATSGQLTLGTGALNANGMAIAFFSHHADEAEAAAGDSVRIDGDNHPNPSKSVSVLVDDDNVVDASWTTSAAWAAVGFELVNSFHLDYELDVPSGTDYDIVKAVVADAAQAVAFIKPIRKVLGIVSVADTAQAISIRIRKTLGVVTTTDTARALVVVKPIRKTLGIVSVADTARALTFIKPIRKTLGIVSVAEAAQVLSYELAGDDTITIIPAQTADTARALTFVKPIRITVGVVSVVDTARALSIRIRKTLGVVTTVDTAQVLVVVKPIRKTLGVVSTADTARALSFIKPIFKALTAVSGANSAQVLRPAKAVTPVPVSSPNQARTLTFIKPIRITLGVVTQLNLARTISFSGPIRVTLDPVTQPNTAQPVSFTKVIFKALVAVTQPNTARPLSFVKPIRKDVSPATQSNTARPLTFVKTIFKSILPATTGNSARELFAGIGTRVTLTPVTTANVAKALSFFVDTDIWPQADHADTWSQLLGSVWPQSTDTNWEP